MNGDPELLWLGAVLLLLLLGATGLCVHCSHPGVKRVEKIYQQRSPQENGESFEVAQNYSLVRQPWPGPLMDMGAAVASPRKDKLQFSCCEDPGSSSRYQNFSKGSQQEPGALSINLVAVDDYNWGCLQKSWEGGSGDGGSSDGNSYENVLVCQPGPPTAGGSRMGTQAGEGSGSRPSSLCPADGEESDYQNCTSIHRWRQAWGAPPGTPAGSPGDHEEPDYVNA